jgi:hypothetical protein
MSKFVVVEEAPKTLEKGEIVVNQPNFMEQIVANQKKAPRSGLTAVNHLREILQTIGLKYDPELNAMRIKLVNYVGLPFSDNTTLSHIVLKILRSEYPKVFDKALEYELQHRPTNTRLIYYVGNFNDTAAFYRSGIDHIELKDVESYMTGKPKKIVGKPAITDEEAKARGQE